MGARPVTQKRQHTVTPLSQLVTCSLLLPYTAGTHSAYALAVFGTATLLFATLDHSTYATRAALKVAYFGWPLTLVLPRSHGWIALAYTAVICIECLYHGRSHR